MNSNTFNSLRDHLWRNLNDTHEMTKTLIKEVIRDDLNAVEQALKSPRLEINAADESGLTALHYACWTGHTKATVLLLTRGADPFLHDKYGFDSFYYANMSTKSAMQRHLSWQARHSFASFREALVTFFKHRSSFEKQSGLKRNNTKITNQAAIVFNNRRFSRHFLTFLGTPVTEFKPEVVTSEDEEKFLDAAKEGDVASVITLVRNGIDVNVRDRRERANGCNAIQHAADNNKYNMLQLLLAIPHLDVNQKDNDDWTALQWAAVANHIICVQLILSHARVDVNSTEAQSMTALHLAAGNDHVQCVQLLLSHPAVDKNPRNLDGRTPLGLAVLFRKTKVISFMRKKECLE